jgi:hypothetical protein
MTHFEHEGDVRVVFSRDDFETRLDNSVHGLRTSIEVRLVEPARPGFERG